MWGQRNGATSSLPAQSYSPSANIIPADRGSEPARRWWCSSAGRASSAPLLSAAAARRCERQPSARWEGTGEQIRVRRTRRERPVRRLGTAAPAGTRSTAGARCPAPQLQAGASETHVGVLALWSEGRMDSAARHQHVFPHQGNGTRPPIGCPPRSAIQDGCPLGLRRLPQRSFRQAAVGCSGRARRLRLHLCGADPLLRPLLVRRAAARHEGARSRRTGIAGTRS